MQDELQAFAFLNLFWQYRKTDLFAYVKYKIEKAPEALDKAVQFLSIPSIDRLGYGRDQYLALLNNFFSDTGRDAEIALVLSQHYIKAYPSIYSQLLETLRSEFAVNSDDKLSNYARQWMLWKNITNGCRERDDLAHSLFRDLFPVIMQTGYKGLQSTKIHFDELGENYPEFLFE
ncbi:MAG: hypothetical protein EOP45_12115 [Sphingobacteriaceae bacterium]|nr:MAG: hypothetical protein EOP45_12115 [Sphingobacteriaceae bacterium]